MVRSQRSLPERLYDSRYAFNQLLLFSWLGRLFLLQDAPTIRRERDQGGRTEGNADAVAEDTNQSRDYERGCPDNWASDRTRWRAKRGRHASGRTRFGNVSGLEHFQRDRNRLEEAGSLRLIQMLYKQQPRAARRTPTCFQSG